MIDGLIRIRVVADWYYELSKALYKPLVIGGRNKAEERCKRKSFVLDHNRVSVRRGDGTGLAANRRSTSRGKVDAKSR